jgi:hypothetical protein
LLQARQRPRVDPLRQHQPAPQVPEVIGQDAQPQSDLVRSKGGFTVWKMKAGSPTPIHVTSLEKAVTESLK